MKKALTKGIFDLTGRTALVTGASRGLGKAIAIALGNAGAELIICSRQYETLEKSAQDIRKITDVRVTTIVVDLTKRSNLRQLTCRALNLTGKIDILVCNAGVDHPKKLEQVDDKTWDYDLELNLTSCMMLTRAFAPQMKERHWGRIIYISSILGITGREGRTIYSASKSALIGLARSDFVNPSRFNNCSTAGPLAGSNKNAGHAMLRVLLRSNPSCLRACPPRIPSIMAEQLKRIHI